MEEEEETKEEVIDGGISGGSYSTHPESPRKKQRIGDKGEDLA